MKGAQRSKPHTKPQKFLGFRISREGKIETAPQSIERLKTKVREMWRSCQSLSSVQLRDRWRAYIRGWWAYYSLSEERKNIFQTEGWIRRHIRKCFWERWHDSQGRLRHLRSLGIRGRQLKAALSSKGAWHLARTGTLQKALNNSVLHKYGFVMPSDLAAAS